MIVRGLWTHVALLGTAALASVYVWTRDKKTAAAAVADVAVWGGRADDVQRITYESKGKKVSLEGKKDETGRWFLGAAESTPPAAPDGGAAPPSPKATTFVSVDKAQKVAEALAPFRALREIGKVTGDRASEFGLKDPEGTLAVTVSGKEHRLTIGGSTPGGADRYVLEEGSGDVYAVKGEFTRDLQSGEGSLSERETHGFKDPDLDAVRVQAQGKTREVLRRGPESKRIWADPSDPEKADETASNWIVKVDRLRPSEYVPQSGGPDAAGDPKLVVRIDYVVKGAHGVFLEVGKLPSQAPPASGAAPTPKSDYFIRTERTRLWAKVPTPAAEQVEQDLGSVLK
jgi:hypothetical protein